MNDKSVDTEPDDARIRAAILRTLESRDRKARFVTELNAALARSNCYAESVERILAELTTEGVVIVRDHFCADPHLAGVDLRIAARVEDDAGADAQMNAIRAIDAAWDKWLGEYLANHRCS
ncbi:MAG TPA: hypothetical protein VHM64_02495 [Candidatus Binatia bacterium]|nr:hypothetical protein [Candidatus Binatia bacterium]